MSDERPELANNDTSFVSAVTNTPRDTKVTVVDDDIRLSEGSFKSPSKRNNRHIQFEGKRRCETCPWLFDEGKFCGGCACCAGDKGLFGYKECCGHKCSGFEPKWIFKILLVSTEMAWALSLQDSDVDYVQDVIRPMSWIAWTSMFLASFLQFYNRMCLGQQPLLNQLTLWIDLIFDDLVQVTALALYWTEGDGWNSIKGDHDAAVFSGLLATFFAFHNIFELVSGGRKYCWGPGFTKDDYNPKDHLEDSWCPYCTIPCCGKIGSWFCNIYPKGSTGRKCCHGLFTCCVDDSEEEADEIECNLLCCHFNYEKMSEDQKASPCRILFYLLTNTWIMALWGIHLGSVTAFLVQWGPGEDNPYSSWSAPFCYWSLSVGVPMILFAYGLEFVRARWLAKHGVQGKITGGKTVDDFKKLNTYMAIVLSINLILGVVPWIAVLGDKMRQDGATTFDVMGVLNTTGICFMSLWTVAKRKLPIFELYRAEASNFLVNNIGALEVDNKSEKKPRGNEKEEYDFDDFLSVNSDTSDISSPSGIKGHYPSRRESPKDFEDSS